MEQTSMPPPPKRGGITFKHKESNSIPPEFVEVRGEVNSLERRLRVMEEGFTNIRRSLQVAEHNMLNKSKTFSTEIKNLTIEIDEIKNEISEIKEKTLMIIKELSIFAKINDVKVLEKYINLWNPVKFVSQNEVLRMIDEKLKKK